MTVVERDGSPDDSVGWRTNHTISRGNLIFTNAWMPGCLGLEAVPFALTGTSFNLYRHILD